MLNWLLDNGVRPSDVYSGFTTPLSCELLPIFPYDEVLTLDLLPHDCAAVKLFESWLSDWFWKS